MVVGESASSISLLPPWHIYERAVCYHLLSEGAKIVTSNVRNFRSDLETYPVDFLTVVPLILEALMNRVKKRIQEASAVKRTIVLSLFAVSNHYVATRRVAQGTALEYAITPAPVWQRLWCRLVTFLLAPLHALADKIVYSKIRA